MAQSSPIVPSILYYSEIIIWSSFVQGGAGEGGRGRDSVLYVPVRAALLLATRPPSQGTTKPFPPDVIFHRGRFLILVGRHLISPAGFHRPGVVFIYDWFYGYRIMSVRTSSGELGLAPLSEYDGTTNKYDGCRLT